MFVKCGIIEVPHILLNNYFEIFLSIFFGIVWGVVVQSVISNKGCDENWFWWGFFFGLFALIVALTKPEVKYEPLAPIIPDSRTLDARTLNSGGWKCFDCGKINASYVTTCTCGMSKIDNNVKIIEKERLNELKEYKEFLDNGIITQEEFEQRKSKVLNP